MSSIISISIKSRSDLDTILKLKAYCEKTGINFSKLTCKLLIAHAESVKEVAEITNIRAYENYKNY